MSAHEEASPSNETGCRFRKKPVVIEAIQFKGYNVKDVMRFMGQNTLVDVAPFLIIPTLEGDHRADQQDWIIKGVKGEFYPCKPDIFASTYEPVQ